MPYTEPTPIIPGPPPELAKITLLYKSDFDEKSVMDAIINKKKEVELSVDGKILPLSTYARGNKWIRLVFTDASYDYEYQSDSGWEKDPINTGSHGSMPPVSADDNGKVFAVIDGQWTKVDLVDLMLEQGLYTPNLATDSWETISKISASGTAANYYAVGDAKAITLNGTMGTLALDMTTYVFILGFDHNAAVEGNGISFGGFKTSAGNDAVDICLIDSDYLSFTIDGSKHFNMNHWGEVYHGPKGDEDRSYNYGGWAGSDMRYDILGSTNVAPDDYGELPAEGREGHNPTSTCATNPVANTLMSCLPAALRAVMKPITKYTDNVGGGNGDVEANVTATIDYLPLASEYEVQASNRRANTNEAAHQAQYAYYAAGNSKIKKEHSSTSDAALWWLRSPIRDGSYDFCIVVEYGDADDGTAGLSLGVAPLFKV